MIKKKNNKKIYCFDIDGVICQTNGSNYLQSRPIYSSIKKINEFYSNNNRIIIFTSRFMGRSNENVMIARKKGYRLTYNQLKKWKVKFHKLIFGKPSYDFIVDDKAINFKNWIKNIK
jgi:histidinol phosphatase-like enzyme